ncbi:MAG: Fic family protein [Clostridia bacterium]
MIIEKSKELLEKLRRNNYRQVPDFGMDTESEMLIRIITNECKSTILASDKQGNIQPRRYESDVIKENLHQIVRQLILNGGTIPKEVMNHIICSDGMIIGVNSDIQLYKGIREQEDGNVERTASIGNSIINLLQLNPDTLKLIEKEIYDRFARQFILQNAEKLPRLNKFSIFKERILHGREDREFINKRFVSVLKSENKYGDDIIRATANYHLDYMYNDKFKNKLLDAASNGTTLIPIETRGKYTSFAQLLSVISAETGDLDNLIPDMNKIHEDIEQVYADVEAQLLAYSTDITKLNANQIEEKIKQINQASLKNPALQQYIGDSGYRKIKVGIKNNDVKMVEVRRVPLCMERLAKDIQDLVQNESSMDKDQYLKRAVQLNYRFIRIHPFTDSNGRTSRALLNMMTIPKGILIEVPKEKKSEFVKAQRDTNDEMDKHGYFELLNDDMQELEQIERDNTELPTYEFIKKNCVIDLQASDYNGSEQIKESVQHEK